jgi:hypothetical protein
MKKRSIKLRLDELSKRTKPLAENRKSDEINLNQRLILTDYAADGKLYKRIDFLHELMTVRVDVMLEELKKREIKAGMLTSLIYAVAFVLVAFVLAPYSDLLRNIFGNQRLPLVDSLVNILMSTAVILFAAKQWIKEKNQKLVKELVDQLHSLIHLFDMHQLAKADQIDSDTRAIISDAVVLCGKVAAYIHDETDDPYVVSSVKHLEKYSELVASRIMHTR